jgi:hypothetical protein
LQQIDDSAHGAIHRESEGPFESACRQSWSRPYASGIFRVEISHLIMISALSCAAEEVVANRAP